MDADTDQDTLTKGYIDAFLTVLIWSGFIIISRIGGKSPLLPYDVTALRFGTAAVILLPVQIARHHVNLLQMRMLALAATGGIGYAMLVYTGFKFAPASHGAILLSGLLPFEITLFSWPLLHEYPSGRRMIGLAAIALGVACLAVETFRQHASGWRGDIAFVAASASWALYTVLVRRWHISVWDATIGTALISAAIYLPVYLLLLPKHLMLAPPGVIIVQAFYQGIMAVIVAGILYIRAVIALGPSKTGMCTATVPAISGIGAALLLHEPLTLPITLGLVFTSFGAWAGNREKSQRPDISS